MLVILHAVLLAFGLIMPLGVQNIFIFQQGASHGTLRRAVPAVVTAAFCDTLLIVLAVSGVSVLILANVWFKTILLAVGVVFLLYMGWATWSSKPRAFEEQMAYSLKKQITFAASVSLMNPHAIMDTIGVIGTSSIAYSGYERLAFTLSCIAVSWSWFTFLALIGRMVGRLDSSVRIMTVLNKCSAVIIWAVAVMLLRSLFT
nr:LysE/ArgO family amino acid transporter [Gorillibacterium massiliense]